MSRAAMNVAMLLSCGSFEGFFGRVQGQTRESYLASYRNDWAWYYASGLLQHGIKPILYIPSLFETGRYQTDAGVDVRFLRLSGWYRPIENVWLKRLSRLTPLSLYADERLNTLAFMKPLRDGLAADDVGLLYIQEYWSGRFDHLAMHIDIPVTGADHGGLSKNVITRFKQRSFDRAAMLYCQTPEECDVVEHHGATRFTLQPNGCDTGQFFPNPDEERGKTILTIARLTNKQKRTTDLIKALALLPADWSLDIVGSGPDLDLLKRCAADSGVTQRVKFHGFLGRQEVRTLLQRCGVYCMPSSNEAVAIAALEAMGTGAAVVLSRIRAFERLVEDGVNGRLVTVGDSAALAAAIVDAWERRNQLGRAAVQTVRERFDAAVLYRELAASLHTAAATARPATGARERLAG